MRARVTTHDELPSDNLATGSSVRGARAAVSLNAGPRDDGFSLNNLLHAGEHNGLGLKNSRRVGGGIEGLAVK